MLVSVADSNLTTGGCMADSGNVGDAGALVNDSAGDGGQERVRLEGLSPEQYEHPLDRAALRALRKTPGLATILKAVFGSVSERSLRLLYLANSVRVGPDQFSDLYQRHLECCAVLGVEEPPDLFVAQTPLVNAGAVGMDNPFIVLNSGTIQLLKGGELDFVLGHEIGHIMSGHVLYKTLLKTALSMTLPMFARIGVPIAGLAIQGLVYALLEWDRKSEYSGDRAGLLCVQSTDAAMRALMKTAGGGDVDNMSVEAFVRQAEEYQQDESIRDSALKFLNLIGRTHPFPVLRVNELKSWVDSGEYQRILDGDYEMNGDEESVSDATADDWESESSQDTPDLWSELFRTVGATVTETGQALKRQVQTLMDSGAGVDAPAADDLDGDGDDVDISVKTETSEAPDEASSEGKGKDNRSL